MENIFHHMTPKTTFLIGGGILAIYMLLSRKGGGSGVSGYSGMDTTTFANAMQSQQDATNKQIETLQGAIASSNDNVNSQMQQMGQQFSDQITQSNDKFTGALTDLGKGFTDALSSQNQTLTSALTAEDQKLADQQKQTSQMITGLQGQFSDSISKLSDSLNHMQYQAPAPAPSYVPPAQVAGTQEHTWTNTQNGVVSGTSFEVVNGDQVTDHGNGSYTVHDSMGGVGNLNKNTGNYSWDYSHENIPSLPASQVSQIKANAKAGKSDIWSVH